MPSALNPSNPPRPCRFSRREVCTPARMTFMIRDDSVDVTPTARCCPWSRVDKPKPGRFRIARDERQVARVAAEAVANGQQVLRPEVVIGLETHLACVPIVLTGRREVRGRIGTIRRWIQLQHRPGGIADPFVRNSIPGKGQAGLRVDDRHAARA